LLIKQLRWRTLSGCPLADSGGQCLAADGGALARRRAQPME